MRVWIIHHYARTPRQAGGTRHFAVARELVRRGHEVTLVAAGRDYLSGRDPIQYGPDGEVVEIVEGVRIVWLRTASHRGNSPRRLLNLVSFAWRARRSPTLRRSLVDVIVGSSPQPLAAAVALDWATARRAGFVYEVRDLWPETLIEGGGLRPWHPVARWFDRIARRCLARARAVVTIPPAAVEYLRGRGATGPIVVIANAADPATFPAPAPDRAGRPFRFVYAGAHGHANGLEVLLDAVARLEETDGPPFEVVLVGDGPARPALEARARAAGLRTTRFESPVPKERLPALLAEADAGIVVLRDSPVLRWGVSPNKLYDYFGAGLPVLFAVNAGNDPVADAAAGVSVDPRSVGSVAEALRRLLTMPAEERRRLGRNGRDYLARERDVGVLTRRFADTIIDARAS